MKDLIEGVKIWAEEKGIYANSTSAKQLEKTGQELVELCIAIGLRDLDGIIDGFGDVLVTLINAAEIEGLELDDCLDVSLREIQRRSGKMVNGLFIKD